LSNYWRPVLLLLFSVEWHLWQGWAPGYHATSALFHAVDSILLYGFLVLLFKNRGLAFAVSLIFLVHPLQTEAVVYASAVSDSLATFFVLLSLIFYTRFRLGPGKKLKNIFYYSGALLLYPLGLMSKETAFMLPGYLFLVELAMGKAALKQRAQSFLRFSWPFLVVAGLYLALRATVLNFNNTFNLYNEENIFTANFSVRLFTFFRILSVYFGLLFLPLDLHVERSVPLAASFFSPSVMGGAALCLGLLFLSVREYRRRPVVTFGILWFFVALFPSSNLIVPINALLYEHFLYLPLIGIFLAVIQYGWEGSQKIGMGKTALGLLGGYLIFFSIITVNRNKDWHDPIRFYEDLLRHAPASYRVINNLGMSYAERGSLEKAEETYKKAIALDPQNPVGHHNLAGIYRNTGRMDLAMETFQHAIHLDRGFIFSYKSLAQIYLDQGDYRSARAALEAALPHTQEKPELLYLLFQLAYEQKDSAGAKLYLKKALELDPQNKNLRSLLKRIESPP